MLSADTQGAAPELPDRPWERREGRGEGETPPGFTDTQKCLCVPSHRGQGSAMSHTQTSCAQSKSRIYFLPFPLQCSCPWISAAPAGWGSLPKAWEVQETQGKNCCSQLSDHSCPPALNTQFESEFKPEFEPKFSPGQLSKQR